MIATTSGKGNQPLNMKAAAELPILKLGLTNFRWSFYFILLLVASLLFRRIFMTRHITLSNASLRATFGFVKLTRMTTSISSEAEILRKIYGNRKLKKNEIIKS